MGRTFEFLVPKCTGTAKQDGTRSRLFSDVTKWRIGRCSRAGCYGVLCGVTGGKNGDAFLSDVQERFSQTTVPEPSSMMLLGSGIFVLARVLRRKLNR
jgi:hypothetical protein